ncbi:hypothetical protein [Fibrobacter sp. UWH1]|uniref:hypothetical protein n=1 Tax=Fibrobacter sp. UWH1 TaxID=1964354 RepID=UPI00159583DF|nr:hypothetical protein [Fibrobacter sp. UWH1]
MLLLDFTLDEDCFTEELLLDLTLDEEFTEELDLAELLLDFTEELLDSRSGSEMTEEDDTSAGALPLTLLLDPSLSLTTLDEEPGMTEEEESSLILEDDSSSSTAELSVLFSPDALVEPESSPQALKANSAKATALTKPIFLIVFIQNLLIKTFISPIEHTLSPGLHRQTFITKDIKEIHLLFLPIRANASQKVPGKNQPQPPVQQAFSI